MSKQRIKGVLTRPRNVITALAAALVVLLAASGWLWWGQRTDFDHGAIVTARQQAINFFSLDHRYIDEDIDRILANSTGDFKQQYKQESERVKQGIAGNKLIVSAEVPDGATAVEYQHGDAAEVLVAVNAKTKSQSEAETNRYRVRVTLRRVDGQWLVSGINQVG